MADFNAADFRAALQINVDKLSSESAQVNSVTRALIVAGHRKAPEVVKGLLDGSTCRLFVWRGTPAGDLFLATGPAFNPRIGQLSELAATDDGIYIKAAADHSKARERASRTTERWHPRVPKTPTAKKRVARAVARAVASMPPVTPSKPARVAKTRAPANKPIDTAAAERAELAASLKALLA